MVTGSEYGAVAGAHRPQTSDLTSKKMSPDGFSTCKQYDALLSMSCEHAQSRELNTTQGGLLTSALGLHRLGF